jgi:hypothetical protein
MSAAKAADAPTLMEARNDPKATAVTMLMAQFYHDSFGYVISAASRNRQV